MAALQTRWMSLGDGWPLSIQGVAWIQILGTTDYLKCLYSPRSVPPPSTNNGIWIASPHCMPQLCLYKGVLSLLTGLNSVRWNGYGYSCTSPLQGQMDRFKLTTGKPTTLVIGVGGTSLYQRAQFLSLSWFREVKVHCILLALHLKRPHRARKTPHERRYTRNDLQLRLERSFRNGKAGTAVVSAPIFLAACSQSTKSAAAANA